MNTAQTEAYSALDLHPVLEPAPVVEERPRRALAAVELRRARLQRDGRAVWHQSYVLDAWGDERGTAMARLVSHPVSLAVEAVQNHRIPAGVHAAPSDPRLFSEWMAEVGKKAQHLAVVDHLI